MSTIGTKNAINTFSYSQGVSSISTKTTFHYTPTVNEEVFEIGVYQGNVSNSGKQMTVSIRDISDTVAGGVSIHDEVIAGTATLSTWNIVTLGTAVQLSAGNTYTVSVFCDTGVWTGNLDNTTGWASDTTLKLTSQTSVPTDFSAASNSSEYPLSAYAETRASSTPPPVGEVITKFTLSLSGVVCESTDFAAGMTGILNYGLAGEELATLTTAIDTAPTATPQFNCTFSKAPVNGVDTISVAYSSTNGDIKSVNGGIALGETLFNSTAIMVC